MVFDVIMVTLRMTLLMKEFYKYCHEQWMSSFAGPQQYLLLSTIRDENIVMDKIKSTW